MVIATLLAGLFLSIAPAQAVGTEAAAPTRGTAKSPDGVDIRYEAAGKGAPTIVFVHGRSCDRAAGAGGGGFDESLNLAALSCA